MTALENLPVAVIGAGPVGLAAAAHLIARFPRMPGRRRRGRHGGDVADLPRLAGLANVARGVDFTWATSSLSQEARIGAVSSWWPFAHVAVSYTAATNLRTLAAFCWSQSRRAYIPET